MHICVQHLMTFQLCFFYLHFYIFSVAYFMCGYIIYIYFVVYSGGLMSDTMKNS